MVYNPQQNKYHKYVCSLQSERSCCQFCSNRSRLSLQLGMLYCKALDQAKTYLFGYNVNPQISFYQYNYSVTVNIAIWHIRITLFSLKTKVYFLLMTMMKELLNLIYLLDRSNKIANYLLDYDHITKQKVNNNLIGLYDMQSIGRHM